MEQYQVEWDPLAENELARLWLGAEDPLAISMAQAQADNFLARDAKKYGRYLSEGLYRIDVSPLIFYFTIDSANASVEVTWVLQSGK